jgi:Mn2+/Fe2+ NRAMP family transporter
MPLSSPSPQPDLLRVRRYLHSAVIQTRAYDRNPKGRASAIRYGTLDSSFSLLFAFLINASILILSGAAFYYGTAQHRCACAAVW